MYGFVHNPGYCEQVDMYNLLHQEKLFKSLKFISDYNADELLVREILSQFGEDSFADLYFAVPENIAERVFPLDALALFFKKTQLVGLYEPNKEIICFSQMYNHIPGHGVLVRKDLVVDSFRDYTKKFVDRQQCIKDINIPKSMRLYVKEECEEFFADVNSQDYKDRKQQEPIQYIIKKGYGAHRAIGIELFQDKFEQYIRDSYKNGAQCGMDNKSIVAQYYIPNPLLLDKENKFDFRIYLLVASIDPLIVYYHDGFLRVSLSKYDKYSKDKNVHFTNTHLSKTIFAEAKGNKIGGATEEELRDYQMWLLEDLQEYLLKTGKVSNKNWLDEELRPKFKQAFVHIARMIEKSLYKTPSVFELFGLDFVMDEDLNIWFIECNPSPQYVGTNDRKTRFLTKMLTDMFEVQFAYYRSRMTRAFNFMNNMFKNTEKEEDINYQTLREEFETKINVNKLEPEYLIGSNNGFKLLIDKNVEGEGAYFGHLSKECIEFD